MAELYLPLKDVNKFMVALYHRLLEVLQAMFVCSLMLSVVAKSMKLQRETGKVVLNNN